MGDEAPLVRVAPRISYPDELPIAARVDELKQAISNNQVVVVAGETGSGKSTQLPKICLEIGRGATARIGHTQPRRLAARSIAERVAQELADPPAGQSGEVGGTVGYAVRFTDRVADHTMVKLMTDGILLAEIRRDRDLRQYDTIIVDEAHERSLNIDFLLGYLHRLLPRRPDLKVIITSATIDTERFAEHFDGAPIVIVEGRTYPVDVRYRDASEIDQPAAIAEAVEDLFTERDGDVLVFCSGEREIRDAIEELALPNTEVIPLFARLSAAEQHRVFGAHRGRRVVVATNIAETSLTVPGIRSVVDVGTARISRFNRRTKVQRLPIEEISQASADQRAGRCGRLGPGVCIRLYTEEDYGDRPEFTEPEIQRTNLASVLLQMAALGIGNVESFPFVDPPDRRLIRDGIAVLEELGAVDPDRVGQQKWLTPLGRRLARLPVDPRLGRMVLEAGELGCLREVLVIAAGLSVQDPKERPLDQREVADEHHARFAVDGSDLMGMVELWRYLDEQRRAGSSSRFRRLCRREFISYRRVREWQDVHAQLRRVSNEIGLRVDGRSEDAAPADLVHRAVLSGLLSHVGQRDPETRDYRGARGARFTIGRESVLGRSGARWVMAGELVETNRMWARQAARIDPRWVEELGDHLVKRSYGEPWWDATQGLGMVDERVTLYGLPIVEGRAVPFRRADPTAARAMFIRHALVEGDWHGRYPFREHNAEVAAQALSVEARTRRSDALARDEELRAFFDERVGADVTSAGHFGRWWKGVRRETPHLLHLSLHDVLAPDIETHDGDYPESWDLGGLHLDVDYEYEPGAASDGITIEIPVNALHRVDRRAFDWLVPGKREELVRELLRALPKEYRKRFVPLADTAREIIGSLSAEPGPVTEVVRNALGQRLGAPIPVDAVRLESLPHHLRPRFRIVDPGGGGLGAGRDLHELSALIDASLRSQLREDGHTVEVGGLTDFDLEEIPTRVRLDSSAVPWGFPALVDEGDAVALRVLPSADEQAASMWAGTRRLLTLVMPSQARALRRLVDNELQRGLAAAGLGSAADWYHDVAAASLDLLLDRAGGPAWTRGAWDVLRQRVADDLHDTIVGVAGASRRILVAAADLRHRMAIEANERLAPTHADVEGQLQRLVFPGFAAALGAERFDDLERYLRAIFARLDAAPGNLRRDHEQMLVVLELEREHDRLRELVGGRPDVDEVAWQLQELRVALFAQSEGARGPISAKRVRSALARILER